MLKFLFYDHNVHLAYEKGETNEVVVSVKSENDEKNVTAIVFPKNVELEIVKKTDENA